MGERVFNFSAGPAILPEVVIEQLREDLRDIAGSGIGIMEHSHRGKVVDRVWEEAEGACRRLGTIPENYRVLFLTGGASTQFFQAPANFLPEGGTADYIVTGSWAEKAAKEAKRYGGVHVAASSEEKNHSYIPGPGETNFSERPAYVHFCSNNTIFGTEFQSEPVCPAGAFLVCDASSDMFSRPLDVSKYGMIYAGAQKNLGPAGVTLVIIRDDVLEKPARDLPTMLRYGVHAEKDSRYNTPPVFAVHAMGLVFKWAIDQGGLEAIHEHNRAKAKLIYDVLDSTDFYRPHVREDSRSLMNVTFRLASEELEAKFVAEAAEQRMPGLKGHRSVGGIRASIYNAMPRAGCEALAGFMREFERRNG